MLYNCRDFGLVVRDLRSRADLTQAEVAERAGVSRVWLSQMENGKPTVELGKVLRVLDVLGHGVDVRPSHRQGSERFRRAFAALDPAAPKPAPGRLPRTPARGDADPALSRR
ncbi:MAG: helix-turn-helix transcriptional regulator [bacterium]|nr:helix-turn-helix transcriptional regulator [bacterium]MCY4102463.1 helix-turn-helix transcriptional regulator [bacterium]